MAQRPSKGKPRVEDDADEPDRPRKKHMKAPGLKLIVILASVALVVVLLGTVGAIVGAYFYFREGPATTPTTYATYKAPEDEFQCQYPAGWSVSAGGPKNLRTVKFTKGSSSIRIRQSLVGSLLGDIAGATANPNDPDDQSPVAKVHEFKKKQAAEEMTNYQEQRAETVTTKFGKGRRSEFTAVGELTWKVRGYRATALGPLIQYEVICQCPESDWQALRPAFAKVIESLGP